MPRPAACSVCSCCHGIPRASCVFPCCFLLFSPRFCGVMGAFSRPADGLRLRWRFATHAGVRGRGPFDLDAPLRVPDGRRPDLRLRHRAQPSASSGRDSPAASPPPFSSLLCPFVRRPAQTPMRRRGPSSTLGKGACTPQASYSVLTGCSAVPGHFCRNLPWGWDWLPQTPVPHGPPPAPLILLANANGRGAERGAVSRAIPSRDHRTAC